MNSPSKLGVLANGAQEENTPERSGGSFKGPNGYPIYRTV
jgi:hypothetical protein